MAAELIVQRDIKQSVIAQGGFSFKLSNKFTIGIPDLGIWLHPFAPFTMEVKDFGVVAERFNRQIGTTPKQRDVMRRMQQSYGNDTWGDYVCGVAVHYSRGRSRFLTLVKPSADNLASGANIATIEKTKDGWNIKKLLNDYGAARVG